MIEIPTGIQHTFLFHTRVYSVSCARWCQFKWRCHGALMASHDNTMAFLCSLYYWHNMFKLYYGTFCYWLEIFTWFILVQNVHHGMCMLL